MNIDRSQLKTYDVATPQRPAPPLPPDGRRPVAPIPTPTEANTNVTINISVPKLKKPSLPNWPYKRIGLYVAAVIGLIVVSLLIRLGVNAALQHKREIDAKNRVDIIDQRQTPTYKPLVPKNSATVAKTAAYDPKRDTYSFSDSLKGTGVVVSQQPLPSGASLADTVAKVAKSINATVPIVATKGPAYLASNQSGAQTVVMGSGSLLIFVQSAFTHTTSEWQSYLDGLHS